MNKECKTINTQSKKIKPVFPQSLAAPVTKLLFKKRYKYTNSLKIKFFDGDYDDGIRYVSLLKLSKQMKRIQTLQACERRWRKGNSFFEPGCKQIIKNYSRINSLYLRRMYTSSMKWLKTGLKHAKQLKRVSCLFNAEKQDELKAFKYFKLDMLDLETDVIPSESMLTKDYFRQVNVVRQISTNYIEERRTYPQPIIKIWFQISINLMEKQNFRRTDFIMQWEYHKNESFQLSPILYQKIISEWEELRVGEEEELHTQPVLSMTVYSKIQDLKNLQYLCMAYPVDTQRYIQVLESFPDLRNLVGLKIFDNTHQNSQDLSGCLQILEQSHKLARLHLLFQDSERPACLLAQIPPIQSLKKFSLEMPRDDKSQLDTLTSLISNLNHLQKLILRILQGNSVLLQKIFEMTKLDRIKLEVKSFRNGDQTEDNQLEFGQDSQFDKLLVRSSDMREFKWGLVLPHPAEREIFLTTVLHRLQNLSQLCISVGKFKEEDFVQDRVLSSLRNLKRLEVLKLVGLPIDSNQKLNDLILVICTLKKLRKVKLGTIYESVSLDFFHKMAQVLLRSLSVTNVCFITRGHYEGDQCRANWNRAKKREHLMTEDISWNDAPTRGRGRERIGRGRGRGRGWRWNQGGYRTSKIIKHYFAKTDDTSD